MFDINRCHFIFKQSTGRTLGLFNKEAAGICLGILNKKKDWNTPSVILKNALPQFYAYLDGSDCIHILSQDSGSQIMYTRFNGTEWETIPVAAGRHSIQGLRHLWIGGFNKSLYLFYTADYPGSSFLYFQQGDINGGLHEPIALDSINISSTAFRIAAGKNGALCVFYVQQNPGGKTAGIRVLKSPTADWSEFISFREEAANMLLDAVSACYAADESLHLLYSKAEDTRYLLCYGRYPGKEGIGRKDEIIATADQPFTNSVLTAAGSLLSVYWTAGSRICYRTSSDNGYAWSKTEEYSFPDNKQIYCMYFSSNAAYEQDFPNSLLLPGSYANGYRPALLKELTEGTQLAPTPAQSKPDESYSQVIEEIGRLSTLQAHIEAELAEFSASLGVLKETAAKLALPEKPEAAAPSGECASIPVVGISTDTRAPFAQPEPKKESDKPPIRQDIPLMPGSGFSFVTPEYLENIKKKQ